MIVVTIEKWAHGNPNERRELGRIEIANDMKGDVESSNYNVRLMTRQGQSQRFAVIKEGRVNEFPRGRYNPDSNPYALLLYALRACLAPKRSDAPAE